jgi:hypothetical protein
MRILVLGYGNWLNNIELMKPYEKSFPTATSLGTLSPV